MRIKIIGTPVDALSFDETVAMARRAMRERVLTHQVSLNVAKLVKMRSDSMLRDDVLASHIISADGMGIVLAGRLLGQRLRGRVAGIDLMIAVLKVCAEEGFRPYFLGAKREVVEKAVKIACERFPKLMPAGMRDGYFSQKDEAEVVSGIAASKADCLFIAMPTPRKERFLNCYRTVLGVPFIMGVGGSLDVMSGLVTRAPQWMQKTGLEWTYRIYQEPRRMLWRYVSTNSIFAFLFIREFSGLLIKGLAGHWNRAGRQIS
jgi:N-acetylglucosaminyldiphosphoundecaprenol N-acetyl-beta-D-mannosaminyltransferase